MEQRRKRHTIDILFAVLLFFVFACSVVTVLLFGAGIYQNTVEASDRHFNSRTSLLYITNMVRQHDEADALAAGSLNGQDAIILKETYETGEYVTYIYSYEGALMEMFVEKGYELACEFGTKIMDIGSLEVENGDDGLIKVKAVSKEGEEDTLFLDTRSR